MSDTDYSTDDEFSDSCIITDAVTNVSADDNTQYKYYTFNSKIDMNAGVLPTSASLRQRAFYTYSPELCWDIMPWSFSHTTNSSTVGDTLKMIRFLTQHYPVTSRQIYVANVLLDIGWHQFLMYNSRVVIGVSKVDTNAQYNVVQHRYDIFYEDIDDFKKFVREVHAAFKKPKAQNDTYNTYYTLSDGRWRMSQTKKKRSANTLFISDNKMKHILDDLRTFDTPECIEEHRDYGVPHIYSAILYGPPGTGKSSLIDVLASELDKCKAVLNIKGMSTASLKYALDNAPLKSIVVLEDIDAIYSGRETITENTASFGDFINILDGSLSTNGLIFILTTNHLEKLEPALFRAARIKRMIELSYIGEAEIKMMWNLHYEKLHNGKFDDFYTTLKTAFDTSAACNGRITPAELLMFLFNNRKNDYDTLIAGIPELISDIDFRNAMEQGIVYGSKSIVSNKFTDMQ